MTSHNAEVLKENAELWKQRALQAEEKVVKLEKDVERLKKKNQALKGVKVTKIYDKDNAEEPAKQKKRKMTGKEDDDDALTKALEESLKPHQRTIEEAIQRHCHVCKNEIKKGSPHRDCHPLVAKKEK